MVLVSVLVSVFVALAVPFLFFSKMDEEKARARRMAEHRMNARLLRFDI